MGLINKHGKDLAGKVFIWYGTTYYIIGEIIRVYVSCLTMYGVDFCILFNSICPEECLFVSFFRVKSLMDDESVLIEDSRKFRKYLELFDGINQ